MAEPQNGGAPAAAPQQQLDAEKKDESWRFIQAQPMREEQVQNAVNFLAHPKVKGSPIAYRRSFLERKGLSKEEIDEAFRRVPDPPMQSAAASPSLAAAAITPPQQQQVAVTVRKGAKWGQILVAIGVLSAAGAGAAVVTKNYLLPKLKSWLRHVVLEDNAELRKPKQPVHDMEAVASAAAQMAAAARELVTCRNEDRRHMERLLQSLEVQNEEIKRAMDAMLRFQTTTRLPFAVSHDDGPGKAVAKAAEDVKVSDGAMPRMEKLSNDRSARPSSAPTYSEVLGMLERGEKPPNIREINDKPPNASQVPSNPLLEPRAKPWETQNAATVVPDQPWWIRKKTPVKITEIVEGDDGTVRDGAPSYSYSPTSSGGWVPPAVPKTVLPGADAAIRRRPKSPPDARQSASASYVDPVSFPPLAAATMRELKTEEGVFLDKRDQDTNVSDEDKQALSYGGGEQAGQDLSYSDALKSVSSPQAEEQQHPNGDNAGSADAEEDKALHPVGEALR